MKKTCVMIFFFLLLLWVVTYAQHDELTINQVVCNRGMASSSVFQFSDWRILSFLAIFASLSLLVFFYMLATLFQNQQAILWVKFELYEIIATIFIIIIVMSIVGITCSLNVGLLAPNSPNARDNIYTGSYKYLNEVGENIIGSMFTLYTVYMPLDMAISTQFRGAPFGLGLQLNPLTGFESLVRPLAYNPMTAMVISYIIIEAQIAVLDYATFGFIKYFLPLGIIFRSFTPTRRIGGTLIALSLAFLFIYPLLLVVNYEVMRQPLSFTKKIGEDITKGKVAASLWDILKEIGAALLSFNIGEMLDKLVGGIMGGFLSLIMLFTLPAVGVIFTAAFVLPAINTLILVSTVRYLSKALGEEIDMTSLTRLI